MLMLRSYLSTEFYGHGVGNVPGTNLFLKYITRECHPRPPKARLAAGGRILAGILNLELKIPDKNVRE